MLERFVRHDRAEIRSADADIDDIADALAGMALPGRRCAADWQNPPSVQNGMDVGDDIAAIVKNRSAARRTQRDMQHGAVLRDVDLVAAEHGVDAVPQPRLREQAATAVSASHR